MHIRPVRVSDVPAMVAIYNHYVTQTIVTFDEEPIDETFVARKVEVVARDYPWLIAEEGGRVLGYAHGGGYRTKPAYRFTVETTVYLDPEQRGRGVGKALYLKLLNLLKDQDYKQAMGVISIPNEASIALHTSFGFKCCGRQVKVGYKFDRWIDIEVWQLDLEAWKA